MTVHKRIISYMHDHILNMCQCPFCFFLLRPRECAERVRSEDAGRRGRQKGPGRGRPGWREQRARRRRRCAAEPVRDPGNCGNRSPWAPPVMCRTNEAIWSFASVSYTTRLRNHWDAYVSTSQLRSNQTWTESSRPWREPGGVKTGRESGRFI